MHKMDYSMIDVMHVIKRNHICPREEHVLSRNVRHKGVTRAECTRV